MPLPPAFAWLANEPGPKILKEALALYGTKEIVGPRHSPAIMGWIQELGYSWIKNDETAWCGIAAAIIAQRAGFPNPSPEAPRAASWLTGWGTAVPTPMLGDFVIWAHHIAMYVGESATHWFVMGGNQGNAFSIVRWSKADKPLGFRRCKWKVAQPANVRKIPLHDTGTPVVGSIL